MTERSAIQWGLTAIPFLVRRSERRTTVALTIDQGALVVTAPPGVPMGRLHDVVRRKAPWVVARIKKTPAPPPEATAREFETGETVLYRGRQLRLKVIASAGDAVPRMWAGWYEVPIAPGLEGEARRREVRSRLLASLLEHAARTLPTMLRDLCARRRIVPPALLVREQSKRWGSCDARGVLRINGRIIQAAPPLIEYVLAHELVHLEHLAHGPAFWATLGRWLPDYEERRRRLRAIGPLLTW